MKRKKETSPDLRAELEAKRKELQALHIGEPRTPSRPGQVTQRRYDFSDVKRDRQKKKEAERAERTKDLLHPELWYDFDMWK